jgi:hypothetical protein
MAWIIWTKELRDDQLVRVALKEDGRLFCFNENCYYSRKTPAKNKNGQPANDTFDVYECKKSGEDRQCCAQIKIVKSAQIGETFLAIRLADNHIHRIVSLDNLLLN